ncbi:hypothetical protein PG993_003133 [Apiospora rasikravindrae]|uniref:Uncharacterized protein n=1 Tax=Apiospora rasikravindrae TaxID=990691 RepID=A0ABR1TYL9_9PEZI
MVNTDHAVDKLAYEEKVDDYRLAGWDVTINIFTEKNRFVPEEIRVAAEATQTAIDHALFKVQETREVLDSLRTDTLSTLRNACELFDRLVPRDKLKRGEDLEMNEHGRHKLSESDRTPNPTYHHGQRDNTPISEEAQELVKHVMGVLEASLTPWPLHSTFPDSMEEIYFFKRTFGHPDRESSQESMVKFAVWMLDISRYTILTTILFKILGTIPTSTSTNVTNAFSKGAIMDLLAQHGRLDDLMGAIRGPQTTTHSRRFCPPHGTFRNSSLSTQSSWKW